MKPTVNRAVHYVSWGSPIQPDGTQRYGRECRAATITEVGAWITTHEHGNVVGERRTLAQEWNPDAVGLHVTNPTGIFLDQGVLYDAGHPGTSGQPGRGSDDDHGRH